MQEFLTIILEIILPIFVVMGIGFILQRKFGMNIATLSKLNIYYVVPAFIFVRLYETEISFELFSDVILFFVIYVAILFVLGNGIGRLLKQDREKRTTFTNSVIFYNSGNYGVPVNELVFKGDAFAMSVQVIVLTLQNIFTFSYGIFSMQSLSGSKLKALVGYFRMPVLYAMLAGVLLGNFDVPIPAAIWTPANYIADAMIGIALLTLGAQVARIEFSQGLGSVYTSVLLRLLVGPVIAFGIILLFGMEGLIAQALLIGSAMPTSVNSSVIAQEYNNYPSLAAQIVLFSTLASSVTVSLVIYAAVNLF